MIAGTSGCDSAIFGVLMVESPGAGALRSGRDLEAR
jgi:hypothetical protein